MQIRILVEDGKLVEPPRENGRSWRALYEAEEIKQAVSGVRVAVRGGAR